MSELFPVIFGGVFLSILGLAVWLFFRILNRPWWEHRWVRRVALIIPLSGLASIALWALGIQAGSGVVSGVGAFGAASTVVIEIALLLTLPISGMIHGIVALSGWLRKRLVPPEKPDPARRLFLKGAAAIFPVAAVTAGAGGVIRSFGPVQLRHFDFAFENLPAELEGLRIFQISDSHIGPYVDLDDIEEMLLKAEPLRPDLVVVTGDVADDLNMLPGALQMISQLNPTYGCYASLGNHEYYRGITRVRQIYSKAPIPLLVNAGVQLEVNGYPLYVGGADDPRRMRQDNSQFLRETIHRCLQNAPADAFKIVMSHRPDGFDFAAAEKAHLTLAGHTHGGQIGIGGKSLFADTVKYIWGQYVKDNGCQLYTTAGVGHWFPFRLGCPPEAPMIRLVNAGPVAVPANS